ncbi:uncharacterized protein LOC124272211 [Haliotis rubra]|uniref:uncharacterized protein LOC124272211 n=1 Tax=Haliotis rubra TaxID=36100 RepID=UPI001EE5A0E8|nr:uncharacterized protein LOC124272211 [Haliotis rubra]
MMQAMINSQQQQTDRLIAKLGPRAGCEMSDSQPRPSTSRHSRSNPNETDVVDSHDSCSEGEVDVSENEYDELEGIFSKSGDKDNYDESDVANLVSELKSFFEDSKETSTDVRSELASTVSDGIRNNVNMKKLKVIMDKYKRPRNCEALIVPAVKEELDVSAMGNTSVNIKDLLVKSMDTIRLMSGAISELNKRRRDGFKPDLSGPYKRLCSTKITTSKWLFGDDLGKKIKEISDSKQLSKKMGENLRRNSLTDIGRTITDNLIRATQSTILVADTGSTPTEVVTPRLNNRTSSRSLFLQKREGERKLQ